MKPSQLLLAVVAIMPLTLASCSKGAQSDKSIETQSATGDMSASISGDSADKSGVALVRVLNAVSGGKTIQVRADDQRMFPSVEFEKATNYTPIDKMWLTFAVGEGGASPFTPLNTNREFLTDGHRYTIVVLRTEDGAEYDSRVIRDDIVNEPGKARVRVIHAAAGVGKLKVQTTSGETFFDGIGFGDTDGFKSFAPMKGALEIRSTDGNKVLFTTDPLAFDAGKSYTVVLSRSAAGKPFAFWIEDAAVN